ncbi:putative beta-lysine N-acetyltransferase [Gracilibacillus salitolerans]|uniref:Putative beta-lysine N-acetyltransferase n=1 Tax=Gracilibacillus salitolerans TaxID=2663022 RepID=A0A5Q2TFC1_9BACI|nr:putative beta-lysine N-acetyltransferase [Gracilibacillus salitolerans]QGH32620.1 putative beta-lysine N-acetyltransferase [Gracilibacillus salitolerans]
MKMLQKSAYDLTFFGQHITVEPTSRRIKVYQLPQTTYMNAFMDRLQRLAKETNCDKLIFYVLPNKQEMMKSYDADYEGMIQGFFNGETALIYAIFLNSDRKQSEDSEAEKQVMQNIKERMKEGLTFDLSEGYSMRWAEKKDASQMALLYKTVFKSYPTPMNDPEFIKEIMQNQVYFSIIEKEGSVVSACSADVLPEYQSAELSDCATYPNHRGKQLLSYQVSRLIPRVKQMGINVLFSYSRSVSVGMNLVNVKHGFQYGGKMIRNSNIAGSMENMNIWYKIL